MAFKTFIDQGYCGACYAFSVVSIFEYMARKARRTNFYSEQNIIDCDYENDGCEGGKKKLQKF